MISKGLPDEIFIVTEYSKLLDIARIIDAINQNEMIFRIDELEISYLINNYIISDGCDNKFISNIDDERRDEPIITSFLYNNSRVIDGNHRLLKRKQDGFTKCKVISIQYKDILNFIEPLGR